MHLDVRYRQVAYAAILILVAFIAGYAVSGLLQKRATETVIPDKIYPCVFCAKDIPAHTVIKVDDLVLRRLPESRLPVAACDSLYIPLGRKLYFEKKKGDVVSLADFGLYRAMVGPINPSEYEKLYHIKLPAEPGEYPKNR